MRGCTYMYVHAFVGRSLSARGVNQATTVAVHASLSHLPTHGGSFREVNDLTEKFSMYMYFLPCTCTSFLGSLQHQPLPRN